MDEMYNEGVGEVVAWT